VDGWVRLGSRNAIRAAIRQITTIQNTAAPYHKPRRSFVESIVILSAHAARSGSISLSGAAWSGCWLLVDAMLQEMP